MDSAGDQVVLQTQLALTVANNILPQGRLWSGQSINCSQLMSRESATGDRPEACKLSMPGKTFANMSVLPDPFLAQLPSDYGTGLIRQYSLRINSSAHRSSIPESEFPADCDSQPGAFYVRYGATHNNIESMTGWRNWSMAACMPPSSTRPLWRATRNRQDFTESLYLNLSSFADDPDYQGLAPEELNGYFEIRLDTTAAYFELPNYMNGEQPGQLLNEDPVTHCGAKGGNCSAQYSRVFQ